MNFSRDLPSKSRRRTQVVSLPAELIEEALVLDLADVLLHFLLLLHCLFVCICLHLYSISMDVLDVYLAAEIRSIRLFPFERLRFLHAHVIHEATKRVFLDTRLLWTRTRVGISSSVSPSRLLWNAIDSSSRLWRFLRMIETVLNGLFWEFN